jgi:hypothetical protein
MAFHAGVAAAMGGLIVAMLVAPAVASASVQRPDAPRSDAPATESEPNEDAGFAARWIRVHDDNRGQPFMIVDKRRAQIYLYAPTGSLTGSSTVLLGQSIGDASIGDIKGLQPSSLTPAQRTTPSGRYASEPGHNALGQDIVWIDYDAALAIHRLRPSPANQHRAERMGSGRTDDKRISYGCIVVPVAFYDAVVQPSLGRQRGMVYVLPETRSVHDAFAQGRFGPGAVESP